MGLGGISIWQLLIILAIVVFIFGTKRLRGMGSDLGGALKGFKKALSEDDANESGKTSATHQTKQAVSPSDASTPSSMSTASSSAPKTAALEKRDEMPSTPAPTKTHVDTHESSSSSDD